jgi:hypothetical protein
MSNLNATVVIIATATVVFHIVARASNQLGSNIDAVLAGVVQGVPMSTQQRLLKLFIMYLSQLAATVAITLVVAFGFLLIGSDAQHDGVRTLAYLCSGLAAFTSLQWLVMGAWYLVYGVQVLRQTDAN